MPLPIFWPGNSRYRKTTAMADITLRLEDMLAQWRHLSAGDRKAIRKRLPLEQQIALDHSLSGRMTADPADTPEQTRREFAMYSPALAALVAGCEGKARPAPTLTPAVRDAIRTAHLRATAQARAPEKPSLIEHVQAAFGAWADRIWAARP